MIFLPLYLLRGPADANQEGISKIGWKTVVCHITIISGKKKKTLTKANVVLKTSQLYAFYFLWVTTRNQLFFVFEIV